MSDTNTTIDTADETTEAKEKRIHAELVADGWEFSAVCIDRGGLNDKSVFDVTVTRKGKSYTTRYTQGCGLRTWKRGHVKLFTVNGNTEYWAKYRHPGKPVQVGGLPRLKSPTDCVNGIKQHQQAVFDGFASLTDPNTPTMVDVLACLVLDCDCVRHGQDFAEFAGNYGYNADSIADKKVYKACGKTWRALIRLGADFDKLAELFAEW